MARTLTAAAAAAAALALLGAAAAFASDEVPLTPRFAIRSGAPFTNSLEVRVGDRGFSPFFRPAVLVWDGGSIVAGSAGGSTATFSKQTMRLIPHPCVSYRSPSRYALISDMLLEAAEEVDARYDPCGDQDVCVVMAGGGDIRKGRRPAAIYRDLVRYCLLRRDAGFRVVVVTLLPRPYPLHFEADRKRLNRLLREGWTGFADGLADVAADHRIGDSGDCYSRTYYTKDHMHVTAAGYRVMAAVTAPLLNRFTWRSSSCEVRFRNAGKEWSQWQLYAARAPWQLEVGDGEKTVEVEYRDASGLVIAASDSIGLDTARPVTSAPFAADAQRAARATLSYLVTDPLPCCGRADVKIKIKTLGGRLVKTLTRPDRPTNTPLTASFTCRLERRTYRFYVLATDAAGNGQAVIGSNKLVVR